MGDTDGEFTVRFQDEHVDPKPSTALVEAIATLEGVAPDALPTARGICLHEYVDPEALDTLVTETEDVSVQTTVDEYEVTVTADALTVRQAHRS
ncbi:HalOD1 output domain-containing protein [Natrialbaceae archaeon A-arb3/5]